MKLLKSNAKNEIVRYPYSIEELRRDYPSISFPSPLEEEVLAAFDCFVVVEKARPTLDNQITNNVVEDVHLFDGQWVQSWIIEEATAEEKATRAAALLLTLDYKGFWKAFTRSASYDALRSAATVDLGANVLATELISVFADAKSNNLDPEAMSAGISAALSAVEAMDESLGLETRELLSTYGLDEYLQ